MAATICICTVLGLSTQARAQTSEMERMLDQYDTPANWANNPAPAPQAVARPMTMPSAGQPAPFSRFQNAGAGPPGGMLRPPGGLGSSTSRSPFAGLTKQDILRIMLGGSASGSKNDPNKGVSGSQSNLQTALDQAAQAEGDAGRASSGNDKGLRQSAAESAQYHANSARAAADRASSEAYSGSSLARDYAAQARNAANRAQSAADRARANASGGGW
jgi:hypothetical protein